MSPDKPDASCAFDEHPGLLTADGRFSFSVIHSYLSKRNYPAHFTKEDTRALRKRVHFACTYDGKLY